MGKLSLGLLIMVGVVACASNPPRAVPVGYGEGFLPADAQIVGQLHLEKVPRLKASLEKHPSLKDIAGRIQRLWFALEVDNYKPGPWKLVLDGDFPKGAVGWVLDSKKEWIKQKTPAEQWHYAGGELAVAIPEERIVVASNQPLTPADLTWKSDLLAHYPGAQMEGGDLVLALKSPVESFLGKAAAKMLRVQDVYVSFQAGSDDLEGTLSLKMDDEKAAKAGTIIMRLLHGGMTAMVEGARREGKEPSPLLELLQDVGWTQEGTWVRGTNFRVKYQAFETFIDKMIPKEG